MDHYNSIDQRIHLLSQIIAKINRKYVMPKPDDSHTNMVIDHWNKHLYGRWVVTENWKGAVLPLSIFNDSSKVEKDLSMLQNFTRTALAQFRFN